MGEPKLRFKADDGSDFPNWEEKTLGELCEPLTYGMNAAATKFDGENRYIRITDIDDETHAFLSNDVVSPSGELDDKYLVKKGDILLARTGASTGKSYLYHPKDGKLFYAGFLIKAHVLPSSDDYFIYSQTLTDRYGKWVKTTSMRSGQPGINANEYASYSFSVPSLPEQHKIADLLSAVDDVISAQEAEVAAWEKRKKGVMQKLFSQEVRFKADDGSDFPDWEEKTLGDLGYFIRGLSYNKTQVLDDGSDASGTAVLRSNNINSDGTLDYRDDVQLVSKEPSSEQQLCENDVVICMANGSNRLVGKAARYDGGYDARRITVGAFCGIFRTDSPLVPWWFQSDDYKSFLHLSKQGGDGALANLKGKDIEAISLLFPSSSTEQREIADCLASLDDVIAKAKDELDAWRELKKGLLQQMFV